MNAAARYRGYTLVEVLVSIVILAMLVAGLASVVGSGTAAFFASEEQTERLREARFALNRMEMAIRESDRLLIPMPDLPATLLNEGLRIQTVPASPPQPGSTLDTAVLALTIGDRQDLDGDGIADADNDGDGRIDEDLPADMSNDGEPGVRGFDDDGNGIADFFFSPAADDDESSNLAADEDPDDGADTDGDGIAGEDPGADNNGDGAPGVAGVDDDGDGSVDEGSADDDDEDGQVDEDWCDVVVFYLDGGTLIERRAVPWDENTDGLVNGRDFVESVVAEGVSELRFERIPLAYVGQEQLVDIRIVLSGDSGTPLALETTARLGAAP